MQPEKQNWNAEDYARNSSAQQQWAGELIDKLALKGNESILDIGCGDGKITAQLARTVHRGNVTGIDLSGNMIHLAMKQFPAAEHPNLTFRHMDATDIRLTRKFDIAFSNAVLHWIADQPSVLKGTHASLKPGGKILFQMGGKGNAAGVSDVIRQVVQGDRWQPCFRNFTPPYHFFEPGEYAGWLAAGGYHITRIELIPKDMQHADSEGLKGWLRTTWFPYTDCLPEELRDPFLSEVTGLYIRENPPDNQGRTHVRMVRLEIEACTL